MKVNDDKKPAVHGMHSLALGSDGRVYMAWLDERNLKLMAMKDMKMDAKSSGHHMESNRELFFASSTDGGHTFTPNQSLLDQEDGLARSVLDKTGVDADLVRQRLETELARLSKVSSASGAAGEVHKRGGCGRRRWWRNEGKSGWR